MEKLANIIAVQAKENYFISITFDDGFIKEINIKPFIKNGISMDLEDIDFFKKVKAQNGYVSWPNGFDFCPEFLRNFI